jgi:hypothetical protein
MQQSVRQLQRRNDMGEIILQSICCVGAGLGLFAYLKRRSRKLGV